MQTISRAFLRITEKDFARLVGTSVSELPHQCRELLAKYDLSYKKIQIKERDKIILNVLKRINSDQLSVSGKENKTRWKKGWRENLKNFIEKKYNLSELVPKYVRPNHPMRLFGEYVVPHDPKFELYYYTIFRIWFFKKYIGKAKTIYEFGCGSGYNLPILAQLFQKAELHGLDWARESKTIVDKLGNIYHWNIQGHVFDMFSPNKKFKLVPNCAVITLGGLEQLGDNSQKFLNYVMKQSPKICLHYEPLLELYNENILFDYLAILYHKRRNYLGNFLTTLKRLESDNKIKILKFKRMFGSLYHDGSYVVWKTNN